MFATLLIGLREGLEAVLIVSILFAYLGRIGRRDLIGRIWIGIAIVFAGSLALGAILTFGAYGLSFQAQEIIGGTLSLVAVGFVTWMVFWMAKASTSLAADLRAHVDERLASGAGLVALGVLAVGREGIETALFVWSTARGTAWAPGPMISLALGVGLAVAIGWLLHRGVVRLHLGRFFAATGALLVVIAAGVVAYGIGDLQEAGVLPGLGATAFDISHVLAPDSPLGALLAGFFNFTPQVSWLQLAGWSAYLVVVLPTFFAALRRKSATPALVPAS